jgi:hypothetical protein
MDTVAIGCNARLDFEVLDDAGAPIPLPAGTKVWVAVRTSIGAAGAPLVEKKNLAAGGAEAQAAITDATAAKVSGYLLPADTVLLAHRGSYVFGCVAELLDGSRYPGGAGEFVAEATVPAPA